MGSWLTQTVQGSLATMQCCFLHFLAAKPKSCDPVSKFQCPGGVCIFKSWLCDGEDDCKGGADELNCSECKCLQCSLLLMLPVLFIVINL